MRWSLGVLILFGQAFHSSKALDRQAIQHILAIRQNRVATASFGMVPWPARFLYLRGGDSSPNELVQDANDAANETRPSSEVNTDMPPITLSKEGFLGRTPIKEILSAGHGAVGANVTVCGWARTVRIQGAGTFAFIELNDGSTFQSLQAHFLPDSPNASLHPAPTLALRVPTRIRHHLHHRNTRWSRSATYAWSPC
jgi:hypothetical protein